MCAPSDKVFTELLSGIGVEPVSIGRPVCPLTHGATPPPTTGLSWYRAEFPPSSSGRSPPRPTTVPWSVTSGVTRIGVRSVAERLTRRSARHYRCEPHGVDRPRTEEAPASISVNRAENSGRGTGRTTARCPRRRPERTEEASDGIDVNHTGSSGLGRKKRPPASARTVRKRRSREQAAPPPPDALGCARHARKKKHPSPPARTTRERQAGEQAVPPHDVPGDARSAPSMQSLSRTRRSVVRRHPRPVRARPRHHAAGAGEDHPSSRSPQSAVRAAQATTPPARPCPPSPPRPDSPRQSPTLDSLPNQPPAHATRATTPPADHTHPRHHTRTAGGNHRRSTTSPTTLTTTLGTTPGDHRGPAPPRPAAQATRATSPSTGPSPPPPRRPEPITGAPPRPHSTPSHPTHPHYSPRTTRSSGITATPRISIIASACQSAVVPIPAIAG